MGVSRVPRRGGRFGGASVVPVVGLAVHLGGLLGRKHERLQLAGGELERVVFPGG